MTFPVDGTNQIKSNGVWIRFCLQFDDNGIFAALIWIKVPFLLFKWSAILNDRKCFVWFKHLRPWNFDCDLQRSEWGAFCLVDNSNWMDLICTQLKWLFLGNWQSDGTYHFVIQFTNLYIDFAKYRYENLRKVIYSYKIEYLKREREGACETSRVYIIVLAL